MGEFQADPMRVAAVERHLQKISEAAIRLFRKRCVQMRPAAGRDIDFRHARHIPVHRFQRAEARGTD